MNMHSTKLKPIIQLVLLILIYANSKGFSQTQCTSFGNFPPTYTGTGVYFGPNQLLGVTYTLNSSAYLSAIGIKRNADIGGVQMAMYTYSAGAPGNLVASTYTSPVTNGTFALNVITPTIIPAGVYYIMAVFQYLGQHVSVNTLPTFTKTVAFTNMTFNTAFPTAPTWTTQNGGDLNYWAVTNPLFSSLSTTICQGSIISLTAAAANTAAITSYSWNTGQTTTNIAVSPSVTTSYTVSATTGTCIATNSLQVLVNPLPNVSFVYSTPSVCPGQSATLSALGANFYQWYPGPLLGQNVVVTPTPATQYTVFGFSAQGCIAPAVTNIGFVPGPPTLTVNNLTGPVCSGGSVALTVSGANTYSWYPSATALTSSVISVAPPSSVIYTVLGSSGACAGSATVAVDINTGPSVTLSSAQASICPGDNVTLSVSSPAATGFTWMPGPFSSSSILVSPSVTTIYSLAAINASGCTSYSTLSQFVAIIPSVSISPSSASICAGTTVSLTASGASSYTWIPGSTISNSLVISPLSSTMYSLVGSNGICSNSASTMVQVVALPTISASGIGSICPGDAAVLSASGAISYFWMPGNISGNSVSVSPQASTIYSVTGSSAGCTSATYTLPVSVANNPSLNVTASSTMICIGANINLLASGANTYTWFPSGLNSASIIASPSVTTNYSVLGENIQGCKSGTNVTVIVNQYPVLIPAISSSAICQGNTTTLQVSGATTYTWLPGSSNASILVVSPGASTNYSISGTSNGCSTSTIINVLVNTNPTLTANASPSVICAGNITSLSVVGANSYTWSVSNSTLTTATNFTSAPLSSGVFSVIGELLNGCTSTETVYLTVNNNPTLNISASSNSLCSGNSSTLNVLGAASYSWLPSQINSNTIVVSPTVTTNYSVIGMSAQGCVSQSVKSITVVTTPTVMIALSPTNTLCSPYDTYTLLANGANSYTWYPGGTVSQSITGPALATIVYSVIGSNSGCFSTDQSTVNVVASPTLFSSASPPYLCVGSSGTLSATGANSYTWMPGGIISASIVANNTITSTYTVSGTNAAGCVSTNTLLYSAYNIPTATLLPITATICAGAGINLYHTTTNTSTWQPGSAAASSIMVNPTTNTTYTATLFNGYCFGNAVREVTVLPVPAITVSASQPTICSGDNSILNPTGGTSYTLNPGVLSANQFTVMPLTSTVYSISTNVGGCIGANTVSVFVSPSPTISVIATPSTICEGSNATLTATGAQSYTWLPSNNQSTTSIVNPTITTTYSISGSTVNCVRTKTILVNVDPQFSLTANSSTNSICIGESVILYGSGAQSYTWLPSSLSSYSINIQPQGSSIYTLQASTGACSKSQTISVIINNLPPINVLSPSVVCIGSSATLTASGATSYTWNPGNITGQLVTITPTSNTTYTIIGSDGTCNASKQITVVVVPLPTLTIPNAQYTICSGTSYTYIASGANTYTWMPGSINSPSLALAPFASSTYTLIGKDLNDCTNSKIFNINLNPPPQLAISLAKAIYCLGEQVNLSANGAVSYTWNSGQIGSTILVTPTTTTTYSVAGNNSFGCTNGASITVVISMCEDVSILAATLLETKIFPNPSYGVFTIEIENDFSALLLSITNTLGELVYSTKLNKGASTFNLQHLQPGVYYIKISANDKTLRIQKHLIDGR